MPEVAKVPILLLSLNSNISLLSLVNVTESIVAVHKSTSNSVRTSGLLAISEMKK